MLLSSGFNPATQMHPLSYNSMEMYLEDVTRQLSPNLIRRSSRGTNGLRVGRSMRVVKNPSSSRNSPQSETLSRRRTVMNDSSYRRRHMGEQSTIVPGYFDTMPAQDRASRPQSWHPTSYLTSQPTSYMSTSTIPFDLSTNFNPYELPPTPAAFSGYTSPSSPFSPLSQPMSGYPEQYALSDNMSLLPTPIDTSNGYMSFQPSALRFQTQTQQMSPMSDGVDPSMYSQFDWNHFAVHGFDHSTAPTTPENPLAIQHQELCLDAEESISYQSLEELDDGGEELVGMGLYDTPEKTTSLDPQLDTYRTLMTSQLFGSTYRKPEAVGKGLKLEETWNPPPGDDGSDDNADEDEDAEGSVADETEHFHGSSQGAVQQPGHTGGDNATSWL